MADDRASAKIQWKHAFVIDEDAITSLWKIISGCGMTVKAAIKCSDDVVKSYSSREELLEYPNAGSARIKSLEISGQGDGRGSEITLNFGGYDSETISGSIACHPPELHTVKEQVSKVLEEIKPRYSAYATFSDIGLMCLVMIVVLALSGYLFHGFIGTSPRDAATKIEFRSMHVIDTAFVMFVFLAAIFAIPFCVQKVREYLFPKHVFALGYGKQRHEFLRNFRLVVVAGMIITFVAGFVAAAVTARMHI